MADPIALTVDPDREFLRQHGAEMADNLDGILTDGPVEAALLSIVARQAGQIVQIAEALVPLLNLAVRESGAAG